MAINPSSWLNRRWAGSEATGVVPQTDRMLSEASAHISVCKGTGAAWPPIFMDEELLPDTPLYRQMTAQVTVDDIMLGIHVGRAANERSFPMREPSERRVYMGDGTILRFDDYLPVNRSFTAIADTFKDTGNAGAVMTRIVALVEMIDAPEMSEWLCPTGSPEDDGMGVKLVLLEVASRFPFTPGTLSFDLHKFVAEVRRVARALRK